MKLTDAIRSGIQFRRPSTGFWLRSDEHLFLTAEDILATNWYLDEQAVEVRATQIREALNSAFQELYSDADGNYASLHKDVENLFIEKLGLKVLSKSADKEKESSKF
jgi:hypothetical protein